MSNATVTPTMRALGWNVEFLATRRDLVFAGTYQPNHNAFMTFRDILQELRLCFDLQNINIGDGFTTSGAWNDIAFGLAGLIDITESDPELGSIPTFIDISNLDVAVPALPENSHSSPEERPLAQYHVLHHNECSLPINQPYASHIQGTLSFATSRSPYDRIEALPDILFNSWMRATYCQTNSPNRPTISPTKEGRFRPSNHNISPPKNKRPQRLPVTHETNGVWLCIPQ